MDANDIQFAVWLFVSLTLGVWLFRDLTRNARPLVQYRWFKRLFIVGPGRYLQRNRWLFIAGAVIIALIQLVRGILFYLAVFRPPG